MQGLPPLGLLVILLEARRQGAPFFFQHIRFTLSGAKFVIELPTIRY